MDSQIEIHFIEIPKMKQKEREDKKVKKLLDVLDDETISLKTDLTIEEKY